MRTVLIVLIACAVALVSAQGPAGANYWRVAGPTSVYAANNKLITSDRSTYVRYVDPMTGTTMSQWNNTLVNGITSFGNDGWGTAFWTADNNVATQSWIFSWNTSTGAMNNWTFGWAGNTSCDITPPIFSNGWMFVMLKSCSATNDAYLYGTNKPYGGSSFWSYVIKGRSSPPFVVVGSNVVTVNSTHLVAIDGASGAVTWGSSVTSLSSTITTLWAYKTFLFATGGTNFWSYDTSNASSTGILYTPYSYVSQQWFYTNSSGDYVFITSSSRLQAWKIGSGGDAPFTWREPNGYTLTIWKRIETNVFLSASTTVYAINPDTNMLTWWYSFPYSVTMITTWGSVLHISTGNSYGYVYVMCGLCFRVLQYQLLYDPVTSVNFLPVWNLTAFVTSSGYFYSFGVYTTNFGQTWNASLTSYSSGYSYYGIAVENDIAYSIYYGSITAVAKNASTMLAMTQWSASNYITNDRLVIVSRGKVVVTASGSIVVIDGTTGALLQTFSSVSSSYVNSLQADPKDGSVYFLDSSADKLSKIVFGTTITLLTTVAMNTGTLTSDSGNSRFDIQDKDSVYVTTTTAIYCFTKSTMLACTAYGTSGKTITGASYLSSPISYDGRVYFIGTYYTTSAGYSTNVWGYGTDSGFQYMQSKIDSSFGYNPAVQPFFFGGNILGFDSFQNLISIKPFSSLVGDVKYNFKTPTALYSGSSTQMTTTIYGGLMVFARYYSLYAYNFTGQSVWNWTATDSSTYLTLGKIGNGVLAVGSDPYIYVFDAYKGKVLYRLYQYSGTLYGLDSINDTIVFNLYTSQGQSNRNFYGFTYYQQFYNASTLPGIFGAAPSNSLLDLLEKNKLWIAGVVAGILVIIIIVLVAKKLSGGGGKKDQDYVAMQQGVNTGGV